jgi:hypothetical protein
MIDSTAQRIAAVTAVCINHGDFPVSSCTEILPAWAPLAGRVSATRCGNRSIDACRLRAAVIHSRTKSASISVISPFNLCSDGRRSGLSAA